MGQPSQFITCLFTLIERSIQPAAHLDVSTAMATQPFNRSHAADLKDGGRSMTWRLFQEGLPNANTVTKRKDEHTDEEEGAVEQKAATVSRYVNISHSLCCFWML